MRHPIRPSIHNLAYAEQLLLRYQHDPASVSKEWREFFASNGGESNGDSIRTVGSHAATSARPTTPREATLHDRLNELIRNYRVRGHLIAKIDPLGAARPAPPELELEHYGFTDAELSLLTNCSALFYDEPLTIREILTRLRETYCGSIGVQYMHIDDVAVRRWMQRRMEGRRPDLKRDEQWRILTRLTDAVVFEEFLRKKFVGAKTFSLEGCETLLPLLDRAVEEAGHQGVRDIVMGMAHRGRLNVLATVVGKDPCQIFREFQGQDAAQWRGRGDVRYHLGYRGAWNTLGGEMINMSLCFNPSHLEYINPVVLGRVRAQQDRRGDGERRQVLGIMIHGDAAFAGEGVVQETLNFSRLPGYRVGGTLHIIINNQIGFTTTPAEYRSTPYATDVARLLQVPIFHVNGEDPEAVAQVVRVAMDFRREYRADVVIDMYGYRRWGHNETDEPAFTQPLLYRQVEARPNVRESYLRHLFKLGGITPEEAENMVNERREKLEEKLTASRSDQCPAPPGLPRVWRDYAGGPEPVEDPDTGVEPQRLAELLRRLGTPPKGFTPHPKLERFLAARREMAAGQRPLDWSAAEALALATLAAEGVRIRLTGQDTARGTFSQRHAVLCDFATGEHHMALAHLGAEAGAVEIINSPLNEAGCVGFEYGYSLDSPDALVLWEAQFGDFANAAQVVIDQFLASAEAKWDQLSGLVLLLPHGFEGMGPEHSSARLERFLSLAAQDNLQIVQPTTPAQYFHVLRRQIRRRWRKPLVVFTPKSLLRHPRVLSPLTEFGSGTFQRLLPEAAPPEKIRRVLLCSGKLYYELEAYRSEHQRADVAILRLEQLYPLRDGFLEEALAAYAPGIPVCWVQEEPRNMGGWTFLSARATGEGPPARRLHGISRPESATPATGSAEAHQLEQTDLIQRAFNDEPAAENNNITTDRPTHS